MTFTFGFENDRGITIITIIYPNFLPSHPKYTPLISVAPGKDVEFFLFENVHFRF